jgi:hypothetical protein
MRRSLLKLLGAGPMMGPHGDGLTRPLNSPPAVPPSYGTQPGTSQAVVIANRVIISGPNGGEFIYDAAGNLRSANVGATTTDPIHGITCNQGFSLFNGFGAVVELQSTSAAAPGYFQYFDNQSNVQGSLIYSFVPRAFISDPVTSTACPILGQVWNGQAGNPASMGFSGGVAGSINVPSVAPFSGWMQFQSFNAYRFDNTVVTATGSSGGAQSLNTGGTGIETWHNMTLLNGWANAAGNTVARYRLIASPSNSVQVEGVLDSSAATAATFITLPAGYHPSGAGGYAVGANGAVSANQAPQLRWANTGSLSIASFTPTAGIAVWITGIIPLD